uniref:Uncharacterized protein n=1 Tax=Arion vulgaris TaxID=1028688 RepID=A0A0B6ZEW2_9EUPU
MSPTPLHGIVSLAGLTPLYGSVSQGKSLTPLYDIGPRACALLHWIIEVEEEDVHLVP